MADEDLFSPGSTLLPYRHAIVSLPQLPHLLLCTVCSFLDFRELGRVAQTSQKFCTMASMNQFWEQALYRHYPGFDQVKGLQLVCP